MREISISEAKASFLDADNLHFYFSNLFAFSPLLSLIFSRLSSFWHRYAVSVSEKSSAYAVKPVTLLQSSGVTLSRAFQSVLSSVNCGRVGLQARNETSVLADFR